jgi:predicted DsbA family dithiol-disulfide isomerase
VVERRVGVVMQVEIWSDVVCPWCYIGKRKFEAALADFDHRDEVTVSWRAYELDPGAPARRDLPMVELLQKKYSMTEEQARAANDRVTAIAAGVGLEYHLDRAAMGNTFDAHRLIHLAAAHGRGDAMKERLMAGYFTEGAAIGETATLESLAADVGLDADEVHATLASDAFAEAVRDDERQAAALGVSGVPFFVIDRAYGISGAQDPEVILGALERAWTDTHPDGRTDASPGDDGTTSCDGEACAV